MVLTTDLEQLENKYDDVVRNRDMLIARHKRAVAEQRIAQTAAQLSAIDPSSQLGHMEERIRLEDGTWFNRAANGDFEGRKLLDNTHVKTRSQTSEFQKVTREAVNR